ncbi:MAG: ribonuclease Y [Nocardioidaceae bacterium]
MILLLSLALGVAVVVAAVAIAIAVRRSGSRPPTPSHGATPDTAPPAPAVLDPLVGRTTDAVHSEAASRVHRDAGTAGIPAPGPLAAGSEPDAQLAKALHALDERRSEVRVQRQEMHAQHVDLERREQRVSQREQRLDDTSRQLDERATEISQADEELASQRAALLDIAAERRAILERLAALTAEDAKQQLVCDIGREAKREAAVVARDIERTAAAEADARAREIITTAIQRLASEQTAESVVSVVHLPSDDMKGRIIGREGRNIRSFEQTTGVNLIIDDTPEAVVLSCFDPVRREVGRITLEELVADGRIHPSRIEEVHARSVAEIDRVCRRAGEDALVEVGVTDVHPHLIATLGQLRYRTSYGQSVLKHLVESAHAAGLMAAELGVDPTVVKRAALLHDLGKALTHEAEGSHALVGAELAHRYGESAEVVHAIEAHHNEVEPRTLEAVLTQAADAISGGRPGARRESPEAYVRRLERLEEIAMGCEGVEKVYAMQAGREIRVMVRPDEVDDIGAQVLARDIVKQVEHELTYPGQIKVTVIRESRTTEIAR